MARVFVGLGSNLGDRATTLQRAVQAIADAGFKITRVSSLYEAAPQDVVDQPSFLNAVVELDTNVPPHDLLRGLLAIETAFGRVRLRDKGPRTLDLDILLYGDLVLREAGLTIPHPAIAQRRFVLDPLVEIAPYLTHPANGDGMSGLLAGVSNQQVIRSEARLHLPD